MKFRGSLSIRYWHESGHLFYLSLSLFHRVVSIEWKSISSRKQIFKYSAAAVDAGSTNSCMHINIMLYYYHPLYKDPHMCEGVIQKKKQHSRVLIADAPHTGYIPTWNGRALCKHWRNFPPDVNFILSVQNEATEQSSLHASATYGMILAEKMLCHRHI